MADRTIPQRELRNDITSILRAVEQEGVTFVITVRGKPVAQLGPVNAEQGPRRFVDRETLLKLYADAPVDPDFAKDLAEIDAWAEDDEDDTWPELKELS